MSSSPIRQRVEAADSAINREDFDQLMDFYTDDATLVVRPGLNASGKVQIRKAFVAIAEHFHHSLAVRQGEMHIVQGGDIALVLAQTQLSGVSAEGAPFDSERHATYVFRQTADGDWRCCIDNSYGTSLIVGSGPMLILVCGKAGAGKSTLARQLAGRPKTVLLVEDDWLASLYPGDIAGVGDYARCAGRLREALSAHILALLGAGLSVVLDFPANTPETRRWSRGLFEQAGVGHELHYLDVTDEECKHRLRARHAAGGHPFTLDDAQFDAITRHFVPPADEEGFRLVRHG